VQYKIAGGILALGVVLWVITWIANKATGTVESKFDDVDQISG
jgi:APA family basic amino acid/polyamine antiporter